MKFLSVLFALVWMCCGIAVGQQATSPVFELPVDCDFSTECSIQKYFDHDPGPGRIDYMCGRLSKNGDTGTDFRLKNYPAMENGVAVLAAADGVVRAVRDGMDDISVREIGHEAVKDREAGNAVVIMHSDGWETQYSHLKKGSIRVAPGDRVVAGEVLGEIGLSGNTEFPHVEFTVRQNGVAIDPFVGPGAFTLCGDAADPVWSKEAQSKLPYRPVVVLSSGFHDGPANADLARRGVLNDGVIDTRAPALVYWADISGTEQGDRELLVMIDPDGKELVRIDRALESHNISWFVFAGVKRPEKGWRVGDYRATYSLFREGKILVETAQTLDLRAWRD